MNDVSIDVDNVNTMAAETMLRAVNHIKRLREYSEQILRCVKDNPMLFRGLEEIDVTPNFDTTSINLMFDGDADRLGKVWGLLRSHGWSTDSRPEAGRPTFSAYWRKEGEAMFWLYFTSTVCKRVKVGTKYVEQDVYEIQCDGPDISQIGKDSTEVAGA